MNKIYLLLTLLSCHAIFSQSQVSENQRTENFIHIWGLLKYQHPEVSKGYFDFNAEFITEFEKLEGITNRDKLNEELLKWAQKFNSGKAKFKSNSKLLKTKGLFTKNADFNWIENSGFSMELISYLTTVKNNGNIGNYYAKMPRLTQYPDFSNEKGIENFDAFKKVHRILFLSSFWNIMRYWNVNIYLTDQKWADVLTEMIPEFSAPEILTFEAAKEKLFTKLNDSHANYEYGYTLSKVYTKYPVFTGKILNDSLVVTTLLNKDLAQKEHIELGDVIYSVNGKDFKSYYTDKFKNLISASTPNYLRRGSERFYILNDSADSIQVGIKKKDGTIHNLYVKLRPYQRYPKELYASLNATKNEKWYKLTDNIGYLNLAKADNKDIKNAFENFENTKGIVIDLRNYPGNSAPKLMKHLYPEKKIFMKILVPIAPGYGEYNYNWPLRFVKDPFAEGGTNKNYYKGKVILLVDRVTGSNGEFVALQIQQAPNCITIGEETFGAVMNRKEITLIDKTTVDYTFAGAFYPDDTGVQRKGLRIDHYIKDSATNYNPNLYIEEAIKIIEK